jgi:DNA polymerase
VEKAATQAFKTGKRQEIGKLAFEFYSGTLWMLLPSGRKLAYLKPRLQPNRFGRMSLTYEGVGQNHKWARQETYSGRLVENATQAIARDILAEAMARMEGYGLNIVGHVHDEVIIEASKDRYTVDEVCKLMSVNPEWCKDLPLNAAGYKGSYYFKD